VEPISIDKVKQFFPEGFRPQFLHLSLRLKIPLICMEDGQEIPPHPSATGIFYVVEGRGEFTVGEEKREVSQGAIVIAPHGIVRGIRAKGRLVVVAFHIS